ncbi:MAG: hypothetical protein CM15mP77_0960 [Synechococcus sp.]|nr:MAG: hypothetical protein CM15mP77_0960 [Synechococcus sp.]
MIYVGSFPPGSSRRRSVSCARFKNLNRVLQLIGQGVLIFAVQKLAQFGQDSFWRILPFRSSAIAAELFSTLQTVELGALEKLSAGDLTYDSPRMPTASARCSTRASTTRCPVFCNCSWFSEPWCGWTGS